MNHFINETSKFYFKLFVYNDESDELYDIIKEYIVIREYFMVHWFLYYDQNLYNIMVHCMQGEEEVNSVKSHQIMVHLLAQHPKIFTYISDDSHPEDVETQDEIDLWIIKTFSELLYFLWNRKKCCYKPFNFKFQLFFILIIHIYVLIFWYSERQLYVFNYFSIFKFNWKVAARHQLIQNGWSCYILRSTLTILLLHSWWEGH